MSGKQKGQNPTQTTRPIPTGFDAGQPRPAIEPLFSEKEMAAILNKASSTPPNLQLYTRGTASNLKLPNTVDSTISTLTQWADTQAETRLSKLLIATKTSTEEKKFFDESKKALEKNAYMYDINQEILDLMGNNLSGTESFSTSDIKEQHQKLYHYMNTMNRLYQDNKMTETQRNTIANIAITALPGETPRPKTVARLNYPTAPTQDTKDMETPRANTAMGNEADTQRRAFSPLSPLDLSSLLSPTTSSPSPQASPQPSSPSASTLQSGDSSSHFQFGETGPTPSPAPRAVTPEEYIRGYYDYISERLNETSGLLNTVEDANPLNFNATTFEIALEELEETIKIEKTRTPPPPLHELAIKRSDFLALLNANVNQLEEITNRDPDRHVDLSASIQDLRKKLSAPQQNAHVNLVDISREITTFPTDNPGAFPDFKFADTTADQESEIELLEKEYQSLTAAQKRIVDNKTNALNAIFTSINDIKMHLGAYSTEPDFSDMDAELRSQHTSFSSAEDALQQTSILPQLADQFMLGNGVTKADILIQLNHSSPDEVIELTRQLIEKISDLKNETLTLMDEEGIFPNLLGTTKKQQGFSDIKDILEDQLNLGALKIDDALETLNTLFTTQDDDRQFTFLHTSNEQSVDELQQDLEDTKIYYEAFKTFAQQNNITFQDLVKQAFPRQDEQLFENSIQTPTLEAAKEFLVKIDGLVGDTVSALDENDEAIPAIRDRIQDTLYDSDSINIEAVFQDLETLQQHVAAIDEQTTLQTSLQDCRDQWTALQSIAAAFEPQDLLEHARAALKKEVLGQQAFEKATELFAKLEQLIPNTLDSVRNDDPNLQPMISALDTRHTNLFDVTDILDTLTQLQTEENINQSNLLQLPGLQDRLEECKELWEETQNIISDINPDFDHASDALMQHVRQIAFTAAQEEIEKALHQATQAYQNAQQPQSARSQPATPDSPNTSRMAAYLQSATKELFNDIDKLAVDIRNQCIDNVESIPGFQTITDVIKARYSSPTNMESNIQAALTGLKQLLTMTDHGVPIYIKTGTAMNDALLNAFIVRLEDCQARFNTLTGNEAALGIETNELLHNAFQERMAEVLARAMQQPIPPISPSAASTIPPASPTRQAQASVITPVASPQASRTPSSVSSARSIVPPPVGVAASALPGGTLRALGDSPASSPASVASSGSKAHTGSYTGKRPASSLVVPSSGSDVDDAASVVSSKKSKAAPQLSLTEANITFSEPAPSDHQFFKELREKFFENVAKTSTLDPHPPFKNAPNTAEHDKELTLNHPIKGDTLTCSVQDKHPKGATTEVSSVQVTQENGAYYLSQENPFNNTGLAGMLEMASAYISTAQEKGKKVTGFEVNYNPVTEKNLNEVILYAAKMQTVLEKWGVKAPLADELKQHKAAIDAAKATIKPTDLPEVVPPTIATKPRLKPGG